MRIVVTTVIMLAIVIIIIIIVIKIRVLEECSIQQKNLKES